jgi:hypothetical protein
VAFSRRPKVSNDVATHRIKFAFLCVVIKTTRLHDLVLLACLSERPNVLSPLVQLSQV